MFLVMVIIFNFDVLLLIMKNQKWISNKKLILFFLCLAFLFITACAEFSIEELSSPG
jgi:choline-glycine betaine transporter